MWIVEATYYIDYEDTQSIVVFAGKQDEAQKVFLDLCSRFDGHFDGDNMFEIHHDRGEMFGDKSSLMMYEVDCSKPFDNVLSHLYYNCEK